MNVCVSGGHGRLGRLVVPALRAAGHVVTAPSRASLDWTQPGAVHRAIAGADAVLALASWTDVRGAQQNPAECVRDTVGTVEATLRAASRCQAVVHYVSTDYVLPVLRCTPGVGVYAAAKLVAEQRVLASSGGRHRVARVAFVTPEQAAGWAWVDGLSVANRCWADQLAPLVVEWMEAPGEQLVHLGRAVPCTLAQLLRERYPAHPALKCVVTDPDELAERAGMQRPRDSCWISE